MRIASWHTRARVSNAAVVEDILPYLQSCRSRLNPFQRLALRELSRVRLLYFTARRIESRDCVLRE